jgi:hypothetical protein
MAAGTDHVASRDLLVETAQSDASVRELRDRGRLASQMVELQYDRIRLSAVDARVGPEERKNVRLSRQAPLFLRSRGLLTVKVTALNEVLTAAASASILATIFVAPERDIRQQTHAAVAPADGWRTPQGQPCRGHRARWRRTGGDEEIDGAGDVAHPNAD